MMESVKECEKVLGHKSETKRNLLFVLLLKEIRMISVKT